MNILREFRRIKNRNLRIKLFLVLIFLIMLISSAYAWLAILSKASVDDLIGVVNSYGVEFYVGDKEILEDEVTLSADEFFPGMSENHQIVSVHNVGSIPIKVQLEITSVKLFGEEILDKLKTENEITEDDSTFNFFTNKNNYPFDVYIKYKNHLEAKDNNSTITEDSIGDIDFCVNWNYSVGNDDLDTEFGKKAFDFYKENESDALEVTIKITAGDF